MTAKTFRRCCCAFGRLPADKAVETARKVCAGLAAAHDKGVIHRDLKPHNIMMNKRGEVLILDFGLAAIVDQLSGSEARNGTPACMSPEQLKGGEVTARGDIYSLGLVLYELFIGKRPYEGQSVAHLIEQQEAAQLRSMTSIATDVDPSVEKVIRRCLDPDPGKRPRGPRAVSAGLPGGDALAAALVRGRTSALPNSPAEYPPDVLAQKARDIAAVFGYRKKPADSKVSPVYRGGMLPYLSTLSEKKWPEWMRAESPYAARYRESQSSLVAWPFGIVSTNDPPRVDPGMVDVLLDGNGHVREFSAVPYRDEGLKEPVTADAVLRATGFDPAIFSEASPTLVPPNAPDQTRAWKAPHPAIANTDVVVEAAWWKGRITHARLCTPASAPARAKTTRPH